MVSKVRVSLTAMLVALMACFLCAGVSQKAWAEGDLTLGMFWNSDSDLSDTLYLSEDGVNFNRISTPFQCEAGSYSDKVIGLNVNYVRSVHDPGLFYKDGNFWTVGSFVQDQGGELGWRLTPTFASSKDLFHWSYSNSGVDVNLKPTVTPAGTMENGQYDSCGGEAFASSDGNVWFITTLGYFGMAHGDDYNDTMSPYICKITKLEPGADQETNPAARPKVTYGDVNPINLPVQCSNWLDPSLYEENGKYYLSIKKDGATNMIFSIDNLDNASDSNAWKLVCDNVVFGYEGPSLTKTNGEYFMYTDKLKNFPFEAPDGTAGTFVTRSSSLESGWCGTQRIVTKGKNADGSTYDIPNRHGSVLRVPDEARETVISAYKKAGWTIKEDNRISRLWGAGAIETAISVVDKAYEGKDAPTTAVLACNSSFYDSMSASGLAGALNAPILLTQTDELSTATKAEIEKLGIKTVYISGGPFSVSDNVKGTLEAMGITVYRVSGENAAETSYKCAQKVVEIAEENGEDVSSEIIVATSNTFQDALSMGGYAYKNKTPILLETLAPEAADRHLTDDQEKLLVSGAYKDAKVIVAGGKASVSDESFDGVRNVDSETEFVRYWGDTAYDTSKNIANALFPNATQVIVATGEQDGLGLDALAGGVLAGQIEGGAPTLLVQGTGGTNYTTVDNFITSSNKSSITNAYILGGTYFMPKSTIYDHLYDVLN